MLIYIDSVTRWRYTYSYWFTEKLRRSVVQLILIKIVLIFLYSTIPFLLLYFVWCMVRHVPLYMIRNIYFNQWSWFKSFKASFEVYEYSLKKWRSENKRFIDLSLFTLCIFLNSHYSLRKNSLNLTYLLYIKNVIVIL